MLDFFKIVEGKIFIIPDYQREYSWDKPQWEAFFKDISQIKDQQHLMGSILTSKYKKELPLKERERFPCYDEKTECVEFIEDDGTALHFYELIDGQQRLTTMLICLSAIKCRLLADENQKYTSTNSILMHKAKKIKRKYSFFMHFFIYFTKNSYFHIYT